jgi:hypothetical protein
MNTNLDQHESIVSSPQLPSPVVTLAMILSIIALCSPCELQLVTSSSLPTVPTLLNLRDIVCVWFHPKIYNNQANTG